MKIYNRYVGQNIFKHLNRKIIHFKIRKYNFYVTELQPELQFQRVDDGLVNAFGALYLRFSTKTIAQSSVQNMKFFLNIQGRQSDSNKKRTS